MENRAPIVSVLIGALGHLVSSPLSQCDPGQGQFGVAVSLLHQGRPWGNG